MNFRVSYHAQIELIRRKIPQNFLDYVLSEPQQIIPEKGGNKAYQSKVEFDNGKVYLIRAIVSDSSDPAVVVTVYRTSKISKYWRKN